MFAKFKSDTCYYTNNMIERQSQSGTGPSHLPTPNEYTIRRDENVLQLSGRYYNHVNTMRARASLSAQTTTYLGRY